MPPGPPRISVVIPTRERPVDVQRALNALAGSTHTAFETLVVVDPEESGTTAERLERMLPASRGDWYSVDTCPGEKRFESRQGMVVRHLSAAARGVSHARNAGARRARGALLAFLDDDCTAPPEWLERIDAGFAQPSPPGLWCGPLRSIPHDRRQVHIPEFVPEASGRIERRWVRPWS